jgi:hypothetical protein
MSPVVRRALLVALFGVAVTACAGHRVATQPDLPPLAPPPPPPRVVVPPEAEPQPPASAPEPQQKTPKRPAAKNEGRDVAPKPEPPKPPAKPEPPPPPARDEAAPPSTLQTTPPASQQEMERQARGLLAQARRDLGLIKPATLNADGKGQFDTASRFVAQTDQALKDRNFVLALSLADKAATIAAVLVGR